MLLRNRNASPSSSPHLLCCGWWKVLTCFSWGATAQAFLLSDRDVGLSPNRSPVVPRAPSEILNVDSFLVRLFSPDPLRQHVSGCLSIWLSPEITPWPACQGAFNIDGNCPPLHLRLADPTICAVWALFEPYMFLSPVLVNHGQFYKPGKSAKTCENL